MKRRLFMLVMLSALAWRAGAQDSICKEKEDLKDCRTRFANQWATSIVQQRTAGANTGVGTLVSASQSTAKDFLTTLAASLLVPANGNAARPISIDYNVPLKLLGEQRLKLQAVLTRPELSENLKSRLSGNTAALTQIKDSMSDIDDVTLSAALQPSTTSLGRSLTPHRDAYETMLQARLPALTAPDAEVRKAAAEFANPFAFLLSNQPQFFGTVLYHARRNFAGADETSARLTYEMGFRNLNAFYRSSRCGDLKDPAACAKQLVEFAGGEKVVADDPANRVSMSVEYRATDGLSVALPQYSVAFHASNAHSLVYSLGYGRTGMMKNSGRFDLAVNYEDTTVTKVKDLMTPPNAVAAASAKDVRDRFVASATYTYKINEMMSIPLALTYANHAAFLGDVGRKLNAHFGITMKMP